MAGGLAILQFAETLGEPVLRLLVGIPLIAVGGALAATSQSRFEANQRALRADDPLPPFRLHRLLAGVIAAVAAMAGVLATIQTLR